MNDSGARLDRITSLGGCLVRGVLGGCAALFLMLCLVPTYTERSLPDLGLIMVAVLATWSALAVRHFQQWATATALVSILATVLLAVYEPSFHSPSMIQEGASLLLLVTRVVWTTRRERLVALTALTGVALIIMPFRASVLGAIVGSAPLAVLVAIAIGVGLYLRAMDARRARALTDARRDERLELARDLHDFVAHHVTGIVVQAQAARFASQSGAGQSPEQLDTMFAGIEKAGTEALTSMRRMVGLLREAQDEGSPGGRTRPVGDLAQVQELVDGFTDPPATLTITDDLGSLAPEVATSVHRIVQEALTNARKHAADATSVRVTIRRIGPDIEVSVRDNGQGRGRRMPSSGYGLAGLSERAETLGGQIHAGPRPEGGWEVVATLPRTLQESSP
ncbi:two-component sensor histidine kinase [Actinomadura barringtoniae]|uniref:histidine kinase n=1 Tax=Actinomadura barringtoniae TaxID=1427535 RepID=A0A939P5R8_9ACTN|nr:histidine kinase [Actinomadura barringtoniae]MBO2445827.1 two-component sensor histidine kinase [Actinomadura barringtoniae]